MASATREIDRSAGDAGGISERELSLWRRWREQGDVVARQELIAQFVPYARVISAMLYARRTHDEVEFDDYLQLASIGLIECVDRYDPGAGAQFKTFAAHRMRGSILNGLERLSEKSQQIAAQTRLRRDRLNSIKAQAAERGDGTAHPPRDLASQSPDDVLLRYLGEVGIGMALCMLLEDTCMVDAQSPGTQLAASPEVGYFRARELQALGVQLRNLLATLPINQRRVLQYHYQQEIPFERVASMLGVTRGRISQLHRQGLMSLRDSLSRGPSCDVTL